MDAGSLLASARLSALLRFAAVVVSGCLGVQGSLRDLHGLGARGGASGMVPAGCGRERTLHPLRLLERNVPAVAGDPGNPDFRAPGLPRWPTRSPWATAASSSTT